MTMDIRDMIRKKIRDAEISAQDYQEFFDKVQISEVSSTFAQFEREALMQQKQLQKMYDKYYK